MEGHRQVGVWKAPDKNRQGLLQFWIVDCEKPGQCLVRWVVSTAAGERLPTAGCVTSPEFPLPISMQTARDGGYCVKGTERGSPLLGQPVGAAALAVPGAVGVSG